MPRPTLDLRPLALGCALLILFPLALGIALWWLVYVVHVGYVVVVGVVVLASGWKAVRTRRLVATGLVAWLAVAASLATPVVPFDLIALGWLTDPETVDRYALVRRPPAALEGLIRLGPNIHPPPVETVERSGERWDVGVLTRERALVLPKSVGDLSALEHTQSEAKRIARVTTWSSDFWTPRAKPQVIWMARTAEAGHHTEVAIHWLPDIDQRSQRAWLWLLSLLLGPTVVWAVYVVRKRPAAFSLGQVWGALPLNRNRAPGRVARPRRRP